jgi:hypothetical protein
VRIIGNIVQPLPLFTDPAPVMSIASKAGGSASAIHAGFKISSPCFLLAGDGMYVLCCKMVGIQKGHPWVNVKI